MTEESKIVESEESDILQAEGNEQGKAEPEEEYHDDLASQRLAAMLGQSEPEEKPEPEQGKQEEEPGNEIINDEITAKYPAAKSLKGMTPEEIAKSYAELQAFHSRTVNELRSQLNQKQASPPAEPKPAQQMTDEELKDFIDMTPAEQRAYLEAREQRIIERIEKEIEKRLTPVQEIQTQKAQQALLNQIQSVTPEGMTAEELLHDWRDANKDRLFNPDGTLNQKLVSFYDQNPEELIHQLQLHAQLKGLAAAKKDQKLEVYNQTKKVLNSSVKATPRIAIPTQREKPVLDRTDEALLKIQERATQNEL